MSTPASFIEDLIDACVMECYFREHMAERDLLLWKGRPAPYAKRKPRLLASQNQGQAAPATLNAPSHPIRNRLLRLTADSPDLLAVIKQESRV